MVADPIGKLYNKDAVIEYFIDKSKYGDGEQICGYLKGVKVSSKPVMPDASAFSCRKVYTDGQDIVTLNLASNPTYNDDPSASASSSTSMPFACPLSLKEMSGTVPFIAIRQCGCVFSEAAIRAVVPSLAKTPSVTPKTAGEAADEAKPVTTPPGGADAEADKTVACPNCGKDIIPAKSDAVLPINPPEEVQEMLLMDLLSARAAAKANKKRKAGPADSVEGAAAEAEKKAKKDEARKGAKRLLAAGDGSRETTPRSSGATPAPASKEGQRAGTGMPTTVKQKLAEQEQKRLAAQANMSEAVRSMFKSKRDPNVKDETTEFFGRTYTRVSAHPFYQWCATGTSELQDPR